MTRIKSPKAVTLVAITATILVFVFVVASASRSPSNPDSENGVLSIGYSRLRISLPIFVAAEMGIFKKYGLNVELKMYETAQPLMQALLDGQVPAAGYTALPIAFNGVLRSEKDLYFITTMIEDREHRISYFLKPRGSALSRIADLRGATIGILPTVAYKAWLESIARENGLDPDRDISIQQVAPRQQAQALRSGGVDALFTNDPAATSAIELGVAELLQVGVVECSEYLRDPFAFGSFNVDKAWADSNPTEFTALLAALDEAVRYVNDNPIKSKRAMLPYLPEVFQPHVESYPPARYLSAAESTSELYRDTVNLYIDAGIISADLPIEQMLIGEGGG